MIEIAVVFVQEKIVTKGAAEGYGLVRYAIRTLYWFAILD
jgi:hypothetical protein